MSGLEVNKIIASIILAILIIIMLSFIGNIMINVNNDGDNNVAYKIEIPNSDENISSTTVQTDISIEPISNLLINASAEKGEKIYKKCGTCHNFEKGKGNKVGPNLWNIINRPKANSDGFAYSKALFNLGGKWGFEELSEFIYKPKEYINGTKMNFSGLSKAEDRANLILFLRNQSDNPIELP